jgi:F420H(2)-dependent quinone reductase
MTGFPAWLVKTLGHLHVAVFRLSRGRLGGRVGKAPVLLLTTTGRRTGKARTTPLLYLRHGEHLAVVASFGGAPRHPAWYLNLFATPEVGVDVRGEQFTATARTATDAERELLWPRLVEIYDGYRGYELKTTRTIPVVLLTRS